jgi:RHH-type proline utilization regulon transcriptional repressor/proline dehydrogenase/delta 1-pyrroline-5-carboxylate dehydrogenase
MLNGNPNMWAPGIKLGVKPESFFHKTECFGPVLGLMRANDLAHAISLANAVDYGLTSGLQSLDDREIAVWRDKIHAGNAYVNRVTTGAIVQRQPFGGWKKSAFGYSKAGGANYVLSLGTWQDKANPASVDQARDAYQQAWKNYFSLEHDPSQVLGESNVFRYRPIKRMILRMDDTVSAEDVERVATGAQIAGVHLRVSVASSEVLPVDLSQYTGVNVVIETDDELIKSLQDEKYRYWQRLRILGALPQSVREAAIEAHVPVINAPVVSSGRIELRHYLLEQAISQTTHRYGNLVAE